MAARLSTKLKKKAMLEALTETLGIVTMAADMVPITRETHYNWLAKDPNYKNAVDNIQNVALDFVEGQLFAQIMNGEPSSTMFYLKTKGKKRGYIERQELVFAGDLEPTEIVLPGGRKVAI